MGITDGDPKKKKIFQHFNKTEINILKKTIKLKLV